VNVTDLGIPNEQLHFQEDLNREVEVEVWGQTLFSGAQRQDKRQRAQTEAEEVPSEYKEELLHSEGDRAV